MVPAQQALAPSPAAPYRPRGAGVAARRQLRVAGSSSSRSTARHAAGSGGGVRGHTKTSRTALRSSSGPSVRPPPRSPLPRERNTINREDLDGAPPSGHEGEYDPRLEAHRWLRAVIGASGGSAHGLGIGVAVAVQDADSWRKKM